VTQELKPGKMIERMKVRRHTEVAGLQDIIRTLQSQLAERERELAEAREAMKRIAYADCTLARAEETARAFLASKEQQ